MQRINYCFGKNLYRIKQKWNPVMTWCKYSHMLSAVREPCGMLQTRKGLLLSQLTVRCRTLQTLAMLVGVETILNLGRHCRPLQECYDGLLIKYLDSLNKEYNDIFELYQTGKKTKEMSSRRVFLEPIVDVYSGMKEKYNELEELQLLVEEDEEMKTMAEAELESINQQIDDMKQQILDILVPDLKYDKKDAILEINPGVGGEEAKLFTLDLYILVPDLKYDKNDAILEINPGVGGEEAKLFTLDLCNMYQKYISYKGWSVEAETSFIEGKCQRPDPISRVPETERGGRIHTSTSAVSILPQPTETHLSLVDLVVRVSRKMTLQSDLHIHLQVLLLLVRKVDHKYRIKECNEQIKRKVI
ncbi:MRF1 [Mytilus edulis]|uniref:PrfA n=1 Tax=Mytilus edulis TaxID=6550 RepID=A0A8S3TF58_MYTED|nr:MRF1 [Mytilus edulis]